MTILRTLLLVSCVLASCGTITIGLFAEEETASQVKTKTLNVLFIGNSYTARHKLADVVKRMAEAGQPGLSFQTTQVIYGGRRLVDHWRLGTQNIVKQHSLTREEITTTIASLKDQIRNNPKDKHAKSALPRHQQLLKEFDQKKSNQNKPQWDIIVLQSYRDDLEGATSKYAEFAPKFAALAKAQGARVVLYETTPTTQNAKPLQETPDPEPILKKSKEIAALANKVDASVAPMALTGLRCQIKRPDLTLRFINDAHLNQTMAYLTACSLYAAIFDDCPVGIPVDSITDIRYLDNQTENRHLDRDGKPITQVFSKTDRADLQRIAWGSYLELKKMRKE